MCATSPISNGVKRLQRIFSWRAGWELRCLRVMVRMKTLIRPMRAQTCASWITETRVALGMVVGWMLSGQRA